MHATRAAVEEGVLPGGVSGCVFPMLSGSGMGDGKTLSIPSPSSTCVVGSGAVAPISSALDQETGLVVDGA